MMTDFEIIYTTLSDGTPCANWAWRGKTPQAVAVLERRGTRISHIRNAKHGRWNDLNVIPRGHPLRYETYETWTDILKAERAFIRSLLGAE